MAHADPDFLLRLAQRNSDDLCAVGEEDGSVSAFVAFALEDVKEWKAGIKQRKANNIRARSLLRDASPPSVDDTSTAACYPEPAKETCGGCCGGASSSTRATQTASAKGRKDRWYFYQAEDSGSVFLHPVNHRCLSTEYAGNFDMASSHITAPVVGIERHTMVEAMRKRYRFLDHLPEGCEFSFVELDLVDVLSADTLASHEAELREREAARERQKVAMKKESVRAKKEMSESFKEHYHAQSGRVGLGISFAEQTVDSRDTQSFPALKEDAAGAGEGESDETDVSQAAASGETSSGDGESGGAGGGAGGAGQDGTELTGSPGAQWGAAVSSYSSVTSKMGLFPSLGEVATGGAPRSPQSGSTRGGAWGPAASPPAQVALSPQSVRKTPGIEVRKGKRAHGKTTIVLSNAGPQYRR